MPTLRALARHARRVHPYTDYTDPDAVRHLRRGYVRARLILAQLILAQLGRIRQERAQ